MRTLHSKTSSTAAKRVLKKVKPVAKKQAPEKNVEDSYNKPKAFEGRQYRGMQTGCSHQWYHHKGE